VVATKEYRDNPILLLNGVSYITVPYKDLIFLATTKTNVNAAMAIQFLYQLIFICKATATARSPRTTSRRSLASSTRSWMR